MKNIQQYFTKRTVLFIAIFAVVGFVALQIPVAQLAGSKAKFTLFDSFAPITASFIGTIPGIFAVFAMQFFNFLLHGADILDKGTIIRFFPILFATLCFARKSMVINVLVPALAIIAFNLDPTGRTVWYYSLFWMIPILCYFIRDRFLLARALGATFTAHAVGGALWIHTFDIPATAWNALIPIVTAERLLFAVGIAASYILVNNLLHVLEQKRIIRLGFHIDQKYLFPWKLAS